MVQKVASLLLLKPKHCIKLKLIAVLGGIHKLREQGRGRGVVLKMFTLVHKGEEGGSENVHVGLNCKYFK